ncbi:peroxisomal 2 4-dienoyl-CoA reductase sps19 [Blastocladiella emersonii ATCC 22665]|nr:peroxisomal 2 4-dienoyl-CoA reductase sps19 [Blastocladiella emersonii ATCC 22665]
MKTPTTDIYSPNLFAGKVAFVTGGGSGICKGMTEALMRHGCDAVIVSRTLAKLEVAAKELEAATGRKCLPVAADVRKPEEVIAAVAKAMETFGRIDIVVAGAAGNFLAPAERLSYRAFKTVIEIDLVGTYNTIKACLEPLKQSKGTVINVTATLQYAGTPMQTHAAAAKNGVDSMTRTLAVELGQYGIRVNGIAPGPIEGTEGIARLMPPGMNKAYINTIPVRRMGTIRDIEMATLYLASEAGSYVTGTVLVVDGGSWMTQTAVMMMGMEEMKKQAKNKL